MIDFTTFNNFNVAAQAICPKAVTALLQNENFKSGCIQQVARTFEQNQVRFHIIKNEIDGQFLYIASFFASVCCS